MQDYEKIVFEAIGINKRIKEYYRYLQKIARPLENCRHPYDKVEVFTIEII